MTLTSLIETYGYAAVLIGTLVKGETTLILAAFAAHQGYLELPYVMATAFVGSISGDHSFFWLGRKRPKKTLERHPGLRARIEKAQAFIEQYQTLLLFTFRFLYGLRTVIPFAIGMGKTPGAKFSAFSVMSCGLWAILLGSAGYLFGEALQNLLGDIKRYEFIAMGAITGIGALVWTIFLFHRKRTRTIFPQGAVSEYGDGTGGFHDKDRF